MNEKEFYIWAGKRIREIRGIKGVTQDELSQKTGIDRTLISKFENSGKKISMFRVKQILEALGLSLADLEIPLEKKTPSTLRYPCQPIMA